MRKLKFHAIALGSICTIITLLYFIMQPDKKPVQQNNVSGKSITIAGATWGKDCNAAISTAIETGQESQLTGKTGPSKLELVEDNNVLSQVAALCDGGETCSFEAEDNTFGVDPLTGCYKHLVIDYRCSTFDALNTATFKQGENARINCRKSAPPKTDAPSPE